MVSVLVQETSELTQVSTSLRAKQLCNQMWKIPNQSGTIHHNYTQDKNKLFFANFIGFWLFVCVGHLVSSYYLQLRFLIFLFCFLQYLKLCTVHTYFKVVTKITGFAVRAIK